MRSTRADASGEQPSGELLGGRYRLDREIARGGMGAIYEAEHVSIGKRVAIKVIRSSDAHHDVTKRFQQEAMITSSLSNPHIVRIFDAGHDPQHGFFMVMEMLEGRDLAAHLRASGALPPLEACEIVYQASRGLEKAHAEKIIHRDLKPSNIFLVTTYDGEVFAKVLDFGVAKALEHEERSNNNLTRAGSSVGTPQYMSPEQAAGLDVLDARTDIYSLGAVLYEALVGEAAVPPLKNYNQMVIRIATVPPPRVADKRPDIDPRIDQLVADMMHRDRHERVPTMRDARLRIGEILEKRDASSRHWVVSRRAAEVTALTPVTGRAVERDVDTEAVEVFSRSSTKQKAEAAVTEPEVEPLNVFDRSTLRLGVAQPVDPDEVDVPIDVEDFDETKGS